MESSSKSFYESMKDDLVKEVKMELYYEAKAEGRILGREEDREEGRCGGLKELEGPPGDEHLPRQRY